MTTSDPLAERSSSWFEISDPHTQSVVFVNLRTGECAIDLPSNAQLLPKDPHGEWWELYDEYHSLPYYYHANSGKAVWTRPEEATVISLTVLQQSVLGQRVSVALSNRASYYLNDEVSIDDSRPLTPVSPLGIDDQLSQTSSQSAEKYDAAATKRYSLKTHPTLPKSQSTGTGVESLGPAKASIPLPSDVDADLNNTFAQAHPGTIPSLGPATPGASLEPLHAPVSSANHGTQCDPTIISQTAESNVPSHTASTLQPPTSDRCDIMLERAFSNTSDQSVSSCCPSPTSSMTDSRPPNITTSTVSQEYTPTSEPVSRAISTPGIAVPLPAGGSPASLNPSLSHLRIPLNNRKSILPLHPSEIRPDSLVSISTMATDMSTTEPASPAWGASSSNQVLSRRTSYFFFDQGRTTRTMSQIINPHGPMPAGHFRAGHLASKSASQIHTLTACRYPIPVQWLADVNKYRLEGFAAEHFSTHKQGLFRRRVPLQYMLRFSVTSLKKPLLKLPKAQHQNARRCFKVIQRIMGNRSRSVLANDNTDTQWLVGHGLDISVLRDEIYLQLCKQLTDNPRLENCLRGWALMAVLTQIFPPTPRLIDYLKTFLQGGFDSSHPRIDILTRFAFVKLHRCVENGAWTRTPTLDELVHSRSLPFNPSIFGESLEFIIRNPMAIDPVLLIPRVLPYLADMILMLNGPQSEGIFRIPGDGEQVQRLRQRLDAGNYTPCPEITDPNIPASLFKLWLRELSEPLIPAQYYPACVQSPQDPDQVLQVMYCLQGVALHVADFVIQFLQVFIRSENSEQSKMTLSNLAVVFAPHFLRCPTDNLKELFVNTQAEQLFVKTLLCAWIGIEIPESRLNNKV
ncbi:hypothetical protein IWQ61_003836 [Dispira simplex]|nr:hypothetical protein IWQ61_003836 [Dispira simplex]